MPPPAAARRSRRNPEEDMQRRQAREEYERQRKLARAKEYALLQQALALDDDARRQQVSRAHALLRQAADEHKVAVRAKTFRRGQFATEATERGGFQPAEPWVEAYMAFRADAIPDALTALATLARQAADRLQQLLVAHDVAILGTDDQAALVDWFLTLPRVVLLSRQEGVPAAMKELEPGLAALRRSVSPVLRQILAVPAMETGLRKLWIWGLHAFDDDLTRLGTEFLAAAQDAIPAFAAHLQAHHVAATKAFDGFRKALVDTLPGPEIPEARRR